MGFSDYVKGKATGMADKLTSGMDSFGSLGDMPTPKEDDSVAMLYPDSRFRGKPTALKVGRYTYKNFVCGNDAVSSVRVKPGYKVTMYEHVDFKGRVRVITEDTANLGSFNDQCSSAVVEKK